jgi:hypothetical protein
MGQCIASLKNLQALRLLSHKCEAKAMIPLEKIKNLKHLSVENGNSNEDKVIQSILLNSASTLRSLVVNTTSYPTGFLQDWEEKISMDDVLAERKHSLTVLKSLTLGGVSFDATFIKSLQRAVDFMGLRELTLGHVLDGKHLFFQHLLSMAISSRNSATGIGLRSLRLDMSGDRHGETLEESQAIFVTICHFISAFDALKTLEIKDYNQYPHIIATNPGLSDTLLQTILTHKNLKTLKISYNQILGNCKMPYLSATTVAALIDKLPQLQNLEFAPEEAEIVGLSHYSTGPILLSILMQINRMKSEKRSPVATTWNISTVPSMKAGLVGLSPLSLVSAS